MTRKRSKTSDKTVEAFKHEEASRKNIPTAEYQSVLRKDEQSPIRLAFECRNRDLDPQLVWRGKDEQDWSDLVVQVPPLYIQEKVHPKVLTDDLLQHTKEQEKENAQQIDLFADFNGLPSESAKTEFYQHDANWSNRLILGDSLQVMASLAEREGLRGKVQCIYIDPPYGIKFNSNFQWSTTNRNVDDRKLEHITREPEQVKAFRDTWLDGVHSYLTYLRDRITVARDLLGPTGSIFIQIGVVNVHRIRALLDELFGEDNFISQISVRKTATPSLFIDDNHFFILWYAKKRNEAKFRKLLRDKPLKEWVTETRGGSWGVTVDNFSRPLTTAERHDPDAVPVGGRVYALSKTNSAGAAKEIQHFSFEGKKHTPGNNAHWKTTIEGMKRVNKAGRLEARGGPPWFRKYHADSPFKRMTNVWDDTSGKSTDRVFVVQTEPEVVARCILMTTDPGDLVLDPTCGSGTTAYVAEQWGRRWITVDTSRVALALARARIMGASYPYYLLTDSREGQLKEAEISRITTLESPTYCDIRQGFVYKRVPYITLKSISKNTEIDVIWEKYQEVLGTLRKQLNKALGKKWEEWEIPRESGDPWDSDTQQIFYVLRVELEKVGKADSPKVNKYLKAINHNLKSNYTIDTLPDRPVNPWPDEATRLHSEWWEKRIARQEEMDASIAAKADYEYLYDKPYEDKKKVRVAGPFTVESLSPHRVLTVDEDDELIDGVSEAEAEYGEVYDFAQMILENLKVAGVQQAHKEDKIDFTSLVPWPGEYVCAEGQYMEDGEEPGNEKRAAIFIGPEFGTVSRPDLVAAAREAGDADFDVLIACAFSYDARSADFDKLGRIPVLKARMNADLHMADDLKNTGKGNLFVIFGEPDIDILDASDGQIQVKINGVDVFHPSTGEVRSDGAEGIACWFIDTDYNEESFFVRHAYFLGANDPYKSLKTTLKSEINKEAWDTLNSDTSRPFDKPESGRIAVKVINHLGDEVMKVFKVD
jgi:adenine-specific DNA-methyltransferase